MNGVINTSTGDLVKAGFADFTNDYDPLVETLVFNVPRPPKVKGPGAGSFHRYTAGNWTTVVGGPPSELQKVNEHTTAYNQILSDNGFTGDAESASDIISWLDGRIDAASDLAALKEEMKIATSGLIRAIAALTYGWKVRPDD